MPKPKGPSASEVKRIKNMTPAEYAAECAKIQAELVGEESLDQDVDGESRLDLMLALANDAQLMAEIEREVAESMPNAHGVEVAGYIEAAWKARIYSARQLGLEVDERPMEPGAFLKMAEAVIMLNRTHKELREHPEKLNEMPFKENSFRA